MTISGGGADLLQTVAALLDDPHRSAVMALAERTVEWIEDGARGKRSVNGLARGNALERKLFRSVGDADPIAIEVALLRAQREMSDRPLAMRIGVNDVPKQASNTEDVWDSRDLTRQRGATRLRGGRLMIVSSKHVGCPTLPGATAIVRPREYPDEAMRQVLHAIREADPEFEIVSIELGDFDADVATARQEVRPPFALRLPKLLAADDFNGPAAILLGTEPRISNTAVAGPARDIKGLRAGRRGTWSDPHHTEIEAPGPDGREVERQAVTVCISDELKIAAPSPFRARIARVKTDPAEGVRLTPEPRLVAVLGAEDHEQVVELAVTTLSANDDHPDIANFMDVRNAARVFLGEQQTRHALWVDRAIASVAVAVHLLDKQAIGA